MILILIYDINTNIDTNDINTDIDTTDINTDIRYQY